jgi:hypothetical protein
VYVLGEERRSFLTGESRGRKTVDMGGCVFGCEKCTRHGRSLFVLERKRERERGVERLMVTSIGADQFPIVIGTYVRVHARGEGRSKIK